MPADSAVCASPRFHCAFRSPNGSPQPKTTFKMTAEFGSQAHFASGWDFGEAQHTFASRLVMAGVDLRTVQELMGHKTIRMTCRYAHLAPKHRLAAVQRLCDTENAQETGATTNATGAFETTATVR